MKEAGEKAKQSSGIAGIVSVKKKRTERAAGFVLLF